MTKSAEVVAADGTKVEVKASDIKVESVAAKDMTPEVKAELDKAYDVIAKAESLEKAVPELKTVLKEAKISTLEPSAVVMRFADGKWVPLALENVTVNKDGTVDVKLDGVGPIAFLVENK